MQRVVFGGFWPLLASIHHARVGVQWRAYRPSEARRAYLYIICTLCAELLYILDMWLFVRYLGGSNWEAHYICRRVCQIRVITLYFVILLAVGTASNQVGIRETAGES